jgi:uncharacterized membrane protein YqjE
LAASEPTYRPVDGERPIGEIVSDVSEKASLLIREEIELAKAEMEQKAKRLARGAVVGVVAGFFSLLGLIFLFDTIAWVLVDAFDWNGIWPGFLVVTLGLFLLAALGGLLALRSFKAGTPPMPEKAIEEAKLIREAVEHPEVQAAAAAQGRAAEQASRESREIPG